MAKKNLKTFFINARIALDTQIEIKAENINDAMEISKGLKLDDFLELRGDNNENKVSIAGVFEEYANTISF